MEFSENFETFNHFNNDPFNLLDEEIPQNIFDELMNDVNCSALGFDMNSVSSEDSGRSSSSYDDGLGSRMDTFSDQATVDATQIKAEIIKQEMADEEPNSPSNFMCDVNAGNQCSAINVTSEPIEVSRPIFATQQTITQIQPQFVLSQPKIVVKQEPIKIHAQPNAQQIFTLQSIGGQQFVVATNAM